MMCLAGLAASAWAPAAEGPAKVATRSAQLVDLQVSFQRTYRVLFDANRRDLAAHRTAAARYRSAAELSRKGNAASRTITDQLALAKAYDDLADRNQAILDQLNHGSLGADLRLAMRALVALENKIASLSNRPLERDWLTLDEFDQLVKQYKGRLPSTDSGMLPFLRDQWQGAR